MTQKTVVSQIASEIIEKEKRSRTGVLDLSRCGLSDIPETIREMTWLTILSFSNSEYWDGYDDQGKWKWYEDASKAIRASNSLRLIPLDIGA